jgi:hypothetical protein
VACQPNQPLTSASNDGFRIRFAPPPLAVAVDAAGFSDVGLDDASAAAVVVEAERVVADVNRAVGIRRRFVTMLDPRAFRGRRGEPAVGSASSRRRRA